MANENPKKQFQCFGTIISDDAERFATSDVSPQNLKAFLTSCKDNEDIEVMINSCGGSVTGGLAIANMIKAYKGKATAHIYGLAASMASVVACACSKIEMDASAFLMIHNPFTYSIGTADDLRKEADLLDQLATAIIGIYQLHFDKTPDEIKAMMDAETWILGSDAKQYGLDATCIPNELPDELKPAALLSLKDFGKAPDAAKALYHLTVKAAKAPDAHSALESKKPNKDVTLSVPASAPVAKTELEAKSPSVIAPTAAVSSSKTKPKPESKTGPKSAAPVAAKPAAPVADPMAQMKERLVSIEAKARDYQSQRDKARASVAELQAKLDASVKDSASTISELKTKCNELETRLASTTLNALGAANPSLASDWNAALKECGTSAEAARKYPQFADFKALADAFGYATARKNYPDKYSEFMRSH